MVFKSTCSPVIGYLKDLKLKMVMYVEGKGKIGLGERQGGRRV
jgi:hypothetical protein